MVELSLWDTAGPLSMKSSFFHFSLIWSCIIHFRSRRIWSTSFIILRGNTCHHDLLLCGQPGITRKCGIQGMFNSDDTVWFLTARLLVVRRDFGVLPWSKGSCWHKTASEPLNWLVTSIAGSCWLVAPICPRSSVCSHLPSALKCDLRDDLAVKERLKRYGTHTVQYEEGLAVARRIRASRYLGMGINSVA